jgi:O-antigen ligase
MVRCAPSLQDGGTLDDRRLPRRLLDVLGAVLIGSAALWMAWTSILSGGSPLPGIELLLACGLGLLMVRTVGGRARLTVPVLVLVTAVIVAARSRTGVLSTAALSGPFRYVNADGAFYVQTAIAGVMLAVAAEQWLLRVVGGVAAGVFATFPFAIHAVAAAWLVAVLPSTALALVAGFGTKGVRAFVGLSAFLLLASMAATIALAATYEPQADSSIYEQAAAKAVNEHRLVLWHAAFSVMRRHPISGVGPSRYQVVSPIASHDPDSRWAHNEFLQQGAEGGVIGLVLLASLFVWGASRLWAVRSPDAVTALSAASLAALGVHASIDYVIHFPLIPIVTAYLVAAGMIETTQVPLGRRRVAASEGER